MTPLEKQKMAAMMTDMEDVEKLLGNKGRFIGDMVHVLIKDLAECYHASQQSDKSELVEALQEIANSKYCNYENTNGMGGQYGIGVTDGHRFCANLAKQALSKLTPKE